MISNSTAAPSRMLAVLATIFAALTLSGCGINNIPTYEQQAKAAWSEVLNQYKRRSDLIDNLVATVKGFAEQEKSVLTEVTEARAKATSINISADQLTDPEALKKFQEAQGALSGALGRLLATVENYPDIKSGQNFRDLQVALEGTENRIAIARRDYIEAVRVYNTEINTLPGRLWKSVMYPAAKDMATFEIPAAEQTAPKVDFEKK